MHIVRKPNQVSDLVMVGHLKDIKNIYGKKDLKNYLVNYLNQDYVHPAIVGAAVEMFYSWGEESGSIVVASKLCDLTPIPTMLEYGSTWWNSIGVYLAYPLINVGTRPEADPTVLRKIVFTAYTALCIGITLSKGKAYDSLSIRSKLMHKYQRSFINFVEKEIDDDFSNVELYGMIFCDKYAASVAYQQEGLTQNFKQTQESLQDIYNWFLSNASHEMEPEGIFKDGNNNHMRYDPEFVQAYNDRKFVVTEEEYRMLFNSEWKF